MLVNFGTNKVIDSATGYWFGFVPNDGTNPDRIMYHNPTGGTIQTVTDVGGVIFANIVAAAV